MKLCWILFSTAILLIGIYVPCEGHIDSTNFQGFIDNYIDVETFKEEGFKSVNATAIHHIWTYFKTKFLRQYSSSEEEKRLQIFRDNLKHVLDSNIRRKHSFQLGLNDYADWTLNEFKSLVSSFISIDGSDSETSKRDYQTSARRRSSALYKDHPHLRRSKRNLHRKREANQSADELDWRTKGVVSSVKQQLLCGSSYAFATTAVLESVYALKTESQNAINFSPQQIVDCSSNGQFFNDGCCYGNSLATLFYVSLEQGGKIATEDSYPYAEKQQRCNKNLANEIDLGTIEGHLIRPGDEKELAEALAEYGPILIALDISSKDFMFYQTGILDIDNCSKNPRDLNHALALVGYSYDNELQKPYWIIKNSLGTGWGEEGYLRLAKDAGNVCGVATDAWFVQLE